MGMIESEGQLEFRSFVRPTDLGVSGWLCVVANIIGAGKLFQKEENDDTGIDLISSVRVKQG